MNRILLMVFCSLAMVSVSAQEEEPPMEQPVIVSSGNTLYGKVTDRETGRGMEAISVQLYTRGAKGDSLIRGMLTKTNGDFRFESLPPADSFRLVITAIGYTTHDQRISFRAGAQGSPEARGPVQRDMGNIPVFPETQALAGIVITAQQRPALEMGMDRRVFNVERSLTAAGGTAIDVMRNIPSVTVDVEGNVQLRNSSPQIFVDGRPTILTLDQIPADQIERVELITNPSAKFDAASSGGIVNVVLKRNKRFGLNGTAAIGGGHPDIRNANLNVNTRQGRFNFFVSGSYNQSGGRARGYTERMNKEHGLVRDYFNQQSLNERLRRFRSLRFGLDFFLDNRNTISITQGLVGGRFSNEEQQDQQYFNKFLIQERYGYRVSEGNSDFNRYNTQLNFSHKFPQQGKELSASINYNYGGGNNQTNILNTFYHPDGHPYGDPARVRNGGSNDNDQITIQVDFEQPSGENRKLEAGARSYINHFSSTFSTFALQGERETKLPLSNNIEYRELVNAFYLTWSNKVGSFSYQAGLRAEHSRFDGTLLDSAKQFGYEYPNSINRLFDALFPSLFLTQQLNEQTELQVNYTRRIRRPNFWQLNPFIDINDPVNISQGNPQLRPEFTNSFELNYNQRYGSGNFLGVLYYRNNQGDITRYSDTITAAQFQQLNNAGVDPNAILNTFINARATNRLGAEFTLQHRVGSGFDITPTLNLQYRKVMADVGDLNLSNEGFNWEAKLITNYRITTKGTSPFNNLGLQLIGEYESPEVIPQGRRLEQYSLDFALRKEFMKNKRAAFTFSINDVFNTNRFGSIYDTDNFFQESFSRRNVRSFRINLSYKFGNADFRLFNRNGRGGDEDDD